MSFSSFENQDYFVSYEVETYSDTDGKEFKKIIFSVNNINIFEIDKISLKGLWVLFSLENSGSVTFNYCNMNKEEVTTTNTDTITTNTTMFGSSLATDGKLIFTSILHLFQ